MNKRLAKNEKENVKRNNTQSHTKTQALIRFSSIFAQSSMSSVFGGGIPLIFACTPYI